MKFLSAVLVALVSTECYAFTVSSMKRPSMVATSTSTSTRTSSSSSYLKSSGSAETEIEIEIETETPTANAQTQKNEARNYNLTPEFAGAYAKAEAGLSAAVAKQELLTPLLHFTKEYLAANQASFQAGNELASAPAAVGRILEAIQLGIRHGTGDEKYLFGASHKALRGNPDNEDGNEFDFYHFGCNFFRPCVQVDKSIVLGQNNLDQAMEYLAKGENVVFLANHQSEADPQVMSICFEKAGLAKQAADIVYVAGHKVTTDPLAIPFSMGRNLICIHSKKHIDAEPEMKPVKQRQNLAAMGGMLDLLKKGGCVLWVAPSGGRDRRDLETGKVPPAPFDTKTIDMFRLMGNKSKVKTHYFPLAMLTYDLCPPPDFIEAGVGEQRNVRFVPVGINCGEAIESQGGLDRRHEFCEIAQQTCLDDYEELVAALHEHI